MKLNNPTTSILKSAAQSMKWAVERVEHNEELADEILGIFADSGIELPEEATSEVEFGYTRNEVTIEFGLLNSLDDDFVKNCLQLVYDHGFRNIRTSDSPEWKRRTFFFRRDADWNMNGKKSANLNLRFKLASEATGCKLIQVDTKTKEIPVYKFDCGEEPIFNPEPTPEELHEEALPEEDNSLYEEVEIEEVVDDSLQEEEDASEDLSGLPVDAS